MRRREMLQQSRLPAEYQEVEWIGTENGYNYIDPGFSVSGKQKFEQKFTVAFMTFTARQLTGGNHVSFWGVNASGFFENYQTSSVQAEVGRYYDIDWYVSKSGNNTYRYFYLDGELILGPSYSTTMMGAEVLTFKIPEGYNCKCHAKLIEYFVNDEKIRELIPCYRKSDSVIGMYDLVGKTFYTNAGTGTFTKGADVL